MQTFIALLRGINVGGRNVLTMTDLRALCTTFGCTPRADFQNPSLPNDLIG